MQQIDSTSRFSGVQKISSTCKWLWPTNCLTRNMGKDVFDYTVARRN